MRLYAAFGAVREVFSAYLLFGPHKKESQLSMTPRDRYRLLETSPPATAPQLNRLRLGTVAAIALLTLTILAAGSHPARAQSTVLSDEVDRVFTGHTCEPDTIPRVGKNVPKGTPLDTLPVELEADSVEAEGDSVVVLRGRAEIVQGRQTVSADELRYNRDEDRVQGVGNVVIHTPSGDRITSDSVDIDINSLTGVAGKTAFKLVDRDAKTDKPRRVVVRARATAENTYLEGEDSMRLEGVTYTTCREGQDDVMVTARELRLDQSTGVGTARGVNVRLGGVPIFYAPYLTFPINDERKTGFLAPAIGASKDSGLILQTPWYWNISPDRDATIVPRLITDRGVQLAGEFRYLSENAEGQVRAEHLPSDDLFGDDRSAASYYHQQRFSDRIDGELDAQWISDEFYLDDLENELEISSATHLPQRGELNYRGDIWSLSGRVFAYQTIDESIAEIDRPFDRLPQLLFNADQTTATGLFRYGVEGELVNFDRDAGVDGVRFDISPYVSVPIRRVYGYVTPRIALRHSSYDLGGVEDGTSSPSRTVPVFSVDSGLYFDRETTFAGSAHTHTLEPRLFYVYIPEENQDDIPVFDTALAELNNFSTIFRENRFFGADRVGDTHQVTAALTTRLIDTDTGAERLSASIGQVFFFDDREVGLSADDEDAEEDTSDLLGEVQANLTPSLSITGFAQYDTDESQMQTWRFDADYQPSARKRLRLGYIDTLDDLEQVDLRVRWPLSDRWDFGLDERYSLSESRNVSTTLRLGYNACCWAVDLAFQRRNDRDEETRNAVLLTLELTGLTRIRAGL